MLDNLEVSTFAELLERRAERRPDQRGFTFLVDGESQEAHLTYGELHQRARTIAAELARVHARGERALLLYPPGLAYIEAFFGCLYAGAIAVPAYPPDPAALGRTLPRLRAIAKDARASVVLTTGALHSIATSLLGQAPELSGARFIATDTLPAELAMSWRPIAASADDIAFLQYTSGSTAEPKGVMVSHRNLLDNSARIRQTFGTSEHSRVVIWLPPYHDMGLIGGILQPLFSGMLVVLMSPLHFLQRPTRWLNAISRYRGTTSGGPNFAYDLCVRKITPEELAALDLGQWTTAFNGAEPIRPDTLRRFCTTFAPTGFRAESFHPCYGLAEATLLVSGGDRGCRVPPLVRGFDAQALAHGRVTAARGDATVELVSCGAPVSGELAIVEPTTGRRCEPHQIGEVWVSGPSVARGYFERPDETAATFRAMQSDRRGPYLRTGDLGFLHEGQLFLVGRSKDLIIIHGRNHYPHDIERTIEAQHDRVRPGCGAAFSVDVDREERLVVVFETDVGREADARALASAIIRTVLDKHALAVHELVLIKSRTIPKTSSGKIQRNACRAAYLAGELAAIASVRGGIGSATDRQPALPAEAPSNAQLAGTAAIRSWLVARMAERAGISPGDIDLHSPLAHLGLSSVAAVELSGELEALLGRRLPPTLVYEHPTIELLAQHLGGADAKPTDGNRPRPYAHTDREPIAIVGIGCRFPSADGPEAFWRLLHDGVDAVSTIPEERVRLCPAFSTTTVPFGGFLSDIDQFDPQLFKISPREAAAMDPQQRLVLDVAWDALEDAGQPIAALAGTSTGVFLGISTNDYGRRNLGRSDIYNVTGNALSIAANRVSYVLDLNGPSVAVDTACSSSLVAIHHACESLWRGESVTALAGGVNLLLAPDVIENLASAGFLAPDGRCKPFDAAANGYVRGEGCGIVVLKRLSAARDCGDRVYATIRGSAVNSDGRSNGLTAPSGRAQLAVLRQAYANAGVDPARVQYVEAHGTGTPLGDPIEARAIAEALTLARTRDRGCRVGSVKSNIGHLEAAAGIAGLIKTALALYHRQLPPTLHFREPNANIPFAELALEVQTRATEWPRGADGAVAGVSSFGFGGTNAHVVLEAADPDVRACDRAPEGDAYVLPISAHGRDALARTTAGYADLLATDPDWAALCAGAATRRTQHDHRVAVVATSSREAAAVFAGALQPEIATGRRPGGRPPSLVFVFSGQGNQWAQMGRDLLEREPVFRAAIDDCDRAFGELAGWSIRDQLVADESHARIGETEVAQPVLFAVQTALVALWRHWGIAPDAVVGHSVGEVGAACAAGALSLRDALTIIAHRGRFMQRTHGRGKMAIVALPLDEATAVLRPYGDRLEIAAENSPRETVVSGEPAALAELGLALAAREVAWRELSGSYAFHSAQMDQVRRELEVALVGLAPQHSRIPLVSTVTGGPIDGTDLGPTYWGRQLRAPVRFSDAIRSLVAAGHEHFMEIGTSVLARSIVEIQRGSSATAASALVISSLRRGMPERTAMLRGLASLYAHGHAVAWSALYTGTPRTAALPRTARSRMRCWVDAGTSERASESTHPLLGRRVSIAGQPHQVWENRLDGPDLDYLRDHRFDGSAVVPAAAFLEMALAAVAGSVGPSALGAIQVKRPLFLSETAPPTTQLVIERDPAGQAHFKIFGRAASPAGASDPWTLHATGAIDAVVPGAPPMAIDPVAVRERCREAISSASFYAGMERRGLAYGASFRGVEQLWRGSGEVLARIKLPASVDLAATPHGYQIHPALLDACAQVIAAIDPDRGAFLPVGAASVRLWRSRSDVAWSHARLASGAISAAERCTFDLSLLDEAGLPVAEIHGLRIQYLDKASLAAETPERWLYDVAWQPRPLLHRLPQAHSPSIWVILTDRGGVGEALANQLIARGDRCVRVEPGDEFERLEPNRFRVDVARAEHLTRVFDSIHDGGELPVHGVVHLWSLDIDRAPGVADMAGLEQAHYRTVHSAIAIIQMLATGAPAAAGARVWLVTAGVQPIAETRGVVPATLWGLGRTVAQEHPELFGGLVDLAPDASPEAMARQLHRELTGSDGEDQIALREDTRYVARLRRTALPAGRHRAGPGGFTCRADSAYLVTGGAGALGLLVARSLVEHGARRIILMSRTALPSRASWAQLPPDSRVGVQISSIRRLESLGATIELAAVDVGNPVELAAFFDRYRSEAWPPIRGVVHAAGVLGDRTLVKLEPALLADVFRAKVNGAWLLDRAFADQPLDFFVLFSSIAAVLGSAGQANYAAANAFLDALAHDRRQRGLPALSINWGPWADTGVAAGSGRGDRLARGGAAGIDPDLGLEMFHRLLDHDIAQVTVMPVDWARIARSYPKLARSPFLSQLIGEPHAAGAKPRSDAGTRQRIGSAAPEHREALVTELLIREITAAVGSTGTAVQADQRLDHLGVDSLMGLELRLRLEAELGTSIPMDTLLAGPTISEFAQLLVARITGTPAPRSIESPRARPEVIQIRSGSRSPLFCVHPGALDSDCYTALAEGLDDAQPFYSVRLAELESSYWGDGGSDLTSIGELAASCIAAIRDIQPEGPYLLGGWSLGGVIALEITRQLERDHQTVTLLAVFDSPAPTDANIPDEADARLVTAFASYLGARHGKLFPAPNGQWDGLDLDARLRRVLDWAQRTSVMPPATDLSQLRSLMDAYARGLRASIRYLAGYAPERCAAPIAYFRATDVLGSYGHVFPDTSSGWHRFTSQPLTLVETPGDHYTMFLPPNAAALATKLGSLLQPKGRP
ncbi:MAG TPA: SDR family NAD(P)-dependent oxidoreductase [Kofleriaceae bacterium]